MYVEVIDCMFMCVYMQWLLGKGLGRMGKEISDTVHVTQYTMTTCGPGVLRKIYKSQIDL